MINVEASQALAALREARDAVKRAERTYYASLAADTAIEELARKAWVAWVGAFEVSDKEDAEFAEEIATNVKERDEIFTGINLSDEERNRFRSFAAQVFEFYPDDLDRKALVSALGKLDIAQTQPRSGTNEVMVRQAWAALSDEEHHALWVARGMT